MLEDDLPKDDMYELLSVQTRREALRYFSQASDDSHTFEDIAQYLHDQTESTMDDIERRLHHVDLPRLQQSNILVYDREKKEVTYIGDEALEEHVNRPE